jgi:hypothetical protein
VTESVNSHIEARLLWISFYLIVGGSLICWAVWGQGIALAFGAGGALAGINLIWLRNAVSGVFFSDPKTSKRRILAGFILRLVLIPLCLYAMIRFLFFSPLAVVAGFAACNCSILIEGILEAFADRS